MQRRKTTPSGGGTGIEMSPDFNGLQGSVLFEAVRARKEMLNHLSQRDYPLPVKMMKRYMQQGSRPVWRGLIKSAPRRTLYMPGSAR